MEKPTTILIFTIDNADSKTQKGEKIGDALNCLFTWEKTHPGGHYWSKVHDNLQHLERGDP